VEKKLSSAPRTPDLPPAVTQSGPSSPSREPFGSLQSFYETRLLWKQLLDRIAGNSLRAGATSSLSPRS
jgi:hypothetical protein